MAQGPQFSNEELARRAIERRTVEAVIWSMPAVNFELMYQAMVQSRGEWNQVVFWSRLAPIAFTHRNGNPRSEQGN